MNNNAIGMIFQSLKNSREFGEFAGILKQLTGLSMALNTPDVGVTCIGVTGDKGNPVCALIRKSPEGCRRCQACDRKQHASAGRSGQPLLYKCHAGFLDLAVPVLIQNQHVATISSGQILPHSHSESGYKTLKKKVSGLGIPDARLQKAYEGAMWLPRNDIRQVMKLIELFARQICESASRIYELESLSGHPAIRRAMEIIDERACEEQLQLKDVASRSGLSHAHFSSLFHQQTGMTFTRYVQVRRVEKAKTLLLKTSRSVTDICFDCGFNNLTHCNRVFRQGTGCSPSQFRSRSATNQR